MSGNQELLSLLRAEPVFQAMAEAERVATDPIQLELLDAVLLDDHRKVAQLLDEEDHHLLLSNRFFLCLSILLVAQSEHKVLKVFMDHGYNAKSKLEMQGLVSGSVIGDIAMAICPLERQSLLVEWGFLKAADWNYHGMSDARPEVFDFWHEQYVQCERERLASSGQKSSPSATLNIYRWLPGVGHRPPTPRSTSQRAEMRRRLDKQMACFLDLNYPAQNERERWGMMLRRPPSVVHHITDAEGVSMLALLIKFQASHLDAPLQSLDMPIPLAPLGDHQGAKWIHALLACGFELHHFEDDLAGGIIAMACDALASGKGINDSLSNLWRTVASYLRRADPHRAASLPGELLDPSFFLSTWVVSIKDDQRQATAQMLSMFAATPPVPAAATVRSAPRL